MSIRDAVIDRTRGPKGRLSRTSVLAIVAGCGLLGLALSRWHPLGPQSMICRHRDDPTGQIDFHVGVGRWG